MNRRVSIIVGCFLFSALLLLGLTSWLSPPAHAGPYSVITVDTVDDELNTDGDCSLREAVEAANTDAAVDACPAGSGDDTIILPAGIYTLTLHGAGEDANQTGDLDILDNLIINGAASGGAIIDGDASDRVLDAHSVALTLNDLQITNGYADFGGGVRNQNGNVEFYRCVFHANSAEIGGGGVHNRASTGGMASMVVSHTQVLENIAVAGFGGGIHNRAIDDASNAVVTVTHSLVAENTTSGSGTQIGGGILNVVRSCSNCEAELYVVSSTVRDNTSDSAGGIYSGKHVSAPLAQVHLTVEGSTLSGNQATVDPDGGSEFLGGGLVVGDGTATLVNSTLSGNFAQYGGGGLAIAGLYGPVTVTITSTSIISNFAGVAGGGLAQVLYNFVPNTTFENTIIAGNAAPFDDGCYRQIGTLTSLGHNLESGDTCGLDQPTDLPNTDPLLGPLQDNGGETWTHALLPLSPALDAGDDAACPPTDQRGDSRPQDGDGDGAAHCDIGAFEAAMEHIYLPLIMKSQDSGGNGQSSAPARPLGIPFTAPSLVLVLIGCLAGYALPKQQRE